MKNDLKDDVDFCKSSKFDMILIGLILLLSAASILRVSRSHSQQSSESTMALVYQGDRLLEEIDLEKDGIVAFTNEEIQTEVKGGRIRIVKSDCPRKICVNAGWIQYSGQTVACVPNRVLIEIESVGSPFLDAVVY